MNLDEDETRSFYDLCKGCGILLIALLIPICSLIAWIAWLVTK